MSADIIEVEVPLAIQIVEVQTPGPQGASGPSDHTLLSNIGTNTHVQIDTHLANTSNPHNVTKTQVGLGNADNTSDVNKPVSTAQAIAIAVVQSDVDAHEANTSNPHSTSAAQVGADPTGTAAAAIAAHVAAPDPHTQYTTVAEAAVAAAIVDTATYASPSLISTAITAPTNQRSRLFVKSTGGAVVVTDITATGGLNRELHIFGCSDTDTVELNDGANLKLSGAIVLKNGTEICLHEVNGFNKWVEAYRNEI
jgi:hypothetical protein